MAKKKNVPESRIGFWQMINNVVLAGMAKGQLLPVLAWVLLLVAILKMPGEDVAKLATDVLNGLKDHSLTGYVMAFVAIPGWYIHSKYQRRIIASELKRVGRERTQAQERLLKLKLPSSED